MHLPELIRDLAIILAIAGGVSLVFHRIRQPVVLGYICAGLAANLTSGPFSPDLKTLAELGVIFLMFSLGLEFSFRKVARLGPSVAFIALFEVGALFGSGYALARALEWSPQHSIFIGAMSAISSTTIIVKALDELGLKTRRFAQLVLGILVFEDLIAILLLVALGGMGSHGAQSQGLGSSLGSLILFVGGWLLVGTFVLPHLLRRVGHTESEEMLMVVSVALCLCLCVVAARLGYSPALGAFIMGSILAESAESHRIEKLVHPLRDLFVAIFFVSVGMLIDPRAIWEYRGLVLMLGAFVIFAKTTFTTVASILSGRSLKTSILVGGSFGQIGEFSFIIAGLGVASGTLDPVLHPVIVAVSVLTTLATPYCIRLAPRVADLAERKGPHRLVNLIEFYSTWSELKQARREQDSALRAALARWAISGFVVTLISHVALRIPTPEVGVGVGLLMLPFLWAFLRGILFTVGDATLRRRVITTASRGVALLICGILAWPFFRGTPIAWALALASFVILAQFVGQLGTAFKWFESTFVQTLKAGKTKSTRKKPVARQLAPWEGQLVRLKINPDSEVSGRTIQEAALRNRFNLNIVAIQRGSRLIVAPLPNQQLFPKDEILVLGDEDSVERARKVIEMGSTETAESHAIESYELRAIAVGEQSPCAHKTIRDSGVRDRFQALVVGVEREGRRLMNPDSELKIEPGDTLWIVGETRKLVELLAEMQENGASIH